ncbi:MAG: PASTA domain-containing protein [Thermonemataceae bacterium]|nr:PASTA domain-containing protein [Thermonemataceae bacterium]
MNILIRSNSIWQVLLHIGIAVLAFLSILLLFFYNYLPTVTNHNETLLVPNLVGLNVENMEKKLKEAGFEMVIQDTIYSKDTKPYTVLEQKPNAGTLVKEGRKIYLVISPKTPPKVPMIDLKGMSYQMAIAKIKTLQLEVGAIRFKPDIARDAVLGQEIGGKPLKKGDLIEVGTAIDIVIGSGVGDEEFDVPELEGLSLEDAKEIIEANGLQLGHITEDPEADEPEGVVVRQNPEARLEADKVPLYDADGKPLTKAEREKIRKEMESKNSQNQDNTKKKKRYKKGEFDPRPHNKIRAGEIIDLRVSANKNYKKKEEDASEQ